jgi:hypothetical protein
MYMSVHSLQICLHGQVLSDGQIHCKWHKGTSSMIWLELYFRLKALLDAAADGGAAHEPEPEPEPAASASGCSFA